MDCKTARRTLLAVSCGLVASLTLGACSSATAPNADPRTIVATTAIWADVVSNIACTGDFTIETLIPPDADPHIYEPTFRDQEKVARGSLIVANGLGLEQAWSDSIENSGREVFTVSDHVTPLPSGDPHMWLDPVLVATVVPDLAAQIVVSTGADEASITACAESYVVELETLDELIRADIATLSDERRVLVTNHDAFGYYAAQYGFEILDTILPSSTLSEASPADLEALEAALAARDIPAIFAEFQHNSAEAEAIADRASGTVEVVYLYTGTFGDSASGADSYVGLMQYDTSAIVAALK